MSRFGTLSFLGAAVGAVLGASPSAHADDVLFPPGTIGPIETTNVQNVDLPPLFGYHQEVDLYNVVQDQVLVGQFTDTHSFFVSPDPTIVLLPFFQDTQDLISNSTYSGLADGAVHNVFFFGIQGIDFDGVILANDYLNNPGIEASDVLTLFGQSFTLFDTSAASTAALDAIDPNLLAELAALF